MPDSENTRKFREEIPIYEGIVLFSGEVSLEFYRDCINLLIDNIDQSLDGVIGSRSSRIGCFGSYENEYLEIIKSIMLYVTKRNLSAITGRFCLAPRTEDFIHMSEIYSSATEDVINGIREVDFYRDFVRLVSKSIICLNIHGTQFSEAEGCGSYNIPTFGFIKYDKISDENSCLFLETKSCFSECVVPNKRFCNLQYNKDTFCPFYHSVRIPSSVREFFMREGNRLIAITRLDDLYPLIDEFLDAPRSGREGCISA